METSTSVNPLAPDTDDGGPASASSGAPVPPARPPARPGLEVKVSGEAIEQYNPAEFARARSTFGVADDFLSTSFSFSAMKPGGGKGGDLLAFTPDGLYVVKEVGGSDQDTLLKATKALVDRFTGESLIARFFLHFRRPADGKDYVVMNNWLPRNPVADWKEVYDLKGSADDKTMVYRSKTVPTVNKRVWKVHMYCGTCAWSEDRHQYYDGKQRAFNQKFHLTKEACKEILIKLRADCEFFREYGLMDYSIIVGLQSAPYDSSAPAVFTAGQAGQPWVCRHGDVVYAWYIGVIDYLQEWTTGKKVARVIKRPVAPQPQSTVPPDKYADQFMAHFEEKFVGDAVHPAAGEFRIVGDQGGGGGGGEPEPESPAVQRGEL